MTDNLKIGIDIGSTTAKIVVLDPQNKMLFGEYRRHYADIRKTVLDVLNEVAPVVGDKACTVSVTGSGGLSLASKLNVSFVQEVIAVASAVKTVAEDADVVIELGGEDAKIIFLKNGMEQRMNGICAGGTGAFIDQMASLLQTDAKGLNAYAKSYRELYPIAARCGVFAKSDIQPLINDGVSREDLSASIFQAVVNQTISGLACGRRISGKVVFLGGPLYFLSELQAAFVRTLKLTPENAIFPEQAHLFAAKGAALRSQKNEASDLNELIELLKDEGNFVTEMTTLPPLFETEADREDFRKRQSAYRVPRADFASYEGKCYLGIDAGSTTMKIAVISECGELLFSWYGSNKGDPVSVAREALLKLYSEKNPKAEIVSTCSTGYGEELLKNAFSMDMGEVETISHYYAARHFEPEVDCVLDIGGQDMKCITIRNGCVDSIILNEACSSGCGSFLENFANSLGFTAHEFAEQSLLGRHPVDLGTRCTVFMNSNVKQAQKDGVAVADIAAGLAYSVIKNALFKVIKLKEASDLGHKIVVQGGTFYNDAVLRCFELVAGVEAIRPDIAGLMGAFGAALIARERYDGRRTEFLGPKELEAFTYTTKMAHCGGCQNQCRLTVNRFSNGRKYISGNRCERGSQGYRSCQEVPNLYEFKKRRIFAYEPLAQEDAPRGVIGMPRALNIYEDYPFWAVFFKKLGFRLVLSPQSDSQTFARGMDSIPSESECYPAKLTHGHIEWLIREGIERIFYPCVVFEHKETRDSQNSFNCPMVTSYPENILLNMENIRENGVKFYNPFISFATEKTLTNCLCKCIHEIFEIPKNEIKEAVVAAWKEQLACKREVLVEGQRALAWAKQHGRTAIVLAGRPYHVDPEVNHGIPEMIQSYGFPVLTEDSVSPVNDHKVKLRATNQWTYHARLYDAALFAAERPDVEYIQLNSFGCGIDAVTIDQVREILESAGRMYTLLKIDEVNNLGAARIRVRSMMAALKMRRASGNREPIPVEDYRRPVYTRKMQKQKYTVLCTGMTQPHFDFFEAALQCCGYNMVLMRSESQNVRDMGLKYVNNDACYPTMIVTGQILDEVFSGKYDTDHLAVFMVQTGGGCRASNYVAFIRKALKDAGFGHIPVISISPNLMETNPGMVYTFKMGFKVLQSLIYGDILMKVLNRTRPYEKKKGSADALFQKWHDRCIRDLLDHRTNDRKFKQNCRDIIREFDRLPIYENLKKPRVGIVGEVLVKYMPAANNHLADTLEREGAEVVVPDFIEFLEYCFYNSVYRQKELDCSRVVAMIGAAAIKVMDVSRKFVMKEFRKSRHFEETTHLEKVKQSAQEIVQIGNMCGEGWFLAGEVVNLIKEGVDNIVCIQPFGCLPNHIVGKGIVKRVKELYPQANIVAVDYDPSASSVNQLNRIKLMMEVAKEKIENEVSGHKRKNVPEV